MLHEADAVIAAPAGSRMDAGWAGAAGFVAGPVSQGQQVQGGGIDEIQESA